MDGSCRVIPGGKPLHTNSTSYDGGHCLPLQLRGHPACGAMLSVVDTPRLQEARRDIGATVTSRPAGS